MKTFMIPGSLLALLVLGVPLARAQDRAGEETNCDQVKLHLDLIRGQFPYLQGVIHDDEVYLSQFQHPSPETIQASLLKATRMVEDDRAQLKAIWSDIYYGGPEGGPSDAALIKDLSDPSGVSARHGDPKGLVEHFKAATGAWEYWSQMQILGTTFSKYAQVWADNQIANFQRQLEDDRKSYDAAEREISRLQQRSTELRCNSSSGTPTTTQTRPAPTAPAVTGSNLPSPRPASTSAATPAAIPPSVRPPSGQSPGNPATAPQSSPSGGGCSDWTKCPISKVPDISGAWKDPYGIVRVFTQIDDTFHCIADYDWGGYRYHEEWAGMVGSNSYGRAPLQAASVAGTVNGRPWDQAKYYSGAGTSAEDANGKTLSLRWANGVEFTRAQ